MPELPELRDLPDLRDPLALRRSVEQREGFIRRANFVLLRAQNSAQDEQSAWRDLGNRQSCLTLRTPPSVASRPGRTPRDIRNDLGGSDGEIQQRLAPTGDRNGRSALL